jgi:transcriptional regulator with XRE-family HTH domain
VKPAQMRKTRSASLSEEAPPLVPEQVKMARAALGLTLEALSAIAKVHRNTISNFETGKSDADPETLARIRRGLEKKGVAFTNGDEPGVKLKRRRSKTARTSQ